MYLCFAIINLKLNYFKTIYDVSEYPPPQALLQFIPTALATCSPGTFSRAYYASEFIYLCSAQETFLIMMSNVSSGCYAQGRK